MGLQLAMEGCHVAVVDIDFEAAVKTANEIKLCNVKSMAYKVRALILFLFYNYFDQTIYTSVIRQKTISHRLMLVIAMR